MIATLRNNLFSWCQIVVLGLMIFVPLFGASPFLGSDARGYIHFWSWRPPIYPIFIWLFHGFGKYQFVATMWAQSTLVFITLLYSRYWLQKYLELPKLVTFLILFFTITVDFLNTHLLQWIYSEGLSFSLFLVVFLLLIENFKIYNVKKMILMVISGSLLILTRGQFNFLYLLFLLIPIWQFWNRKPVKQILFNLSIIIISIFLAVLLERGYHYYLHGQFRGSSYVGRMLVVQPLYLSDASAAKYFENPLEKSIFLKIMNELEEKHLTRKSAPPSVLTKYPRTTLDYFNNNFNLIDDTFPIVYQPGVYPPDIPVFDYQTDAQFFNIAKTLILHAPIENLNLYIWKVTSNFASPWIFLAFLITFIVIIIRVMDRCYQPNMKQMFIIGSLLFILANASFVAIFQCYSQRYFIYTYFLYFCLSGLLANEFLAKPSTEKIIKTSLTNSG